MKKKVDIGINIAPAGVTQSRDGLGSTSGQKSADWEGEVPALIPSGDYGTDFVPGLSKKGSRGGR